MKKPMIVSFSGGRTSAYMAWQMTHGELKGAYADYDLYFLFANTGCEHEKTLEFVHNCEKHFGWRVVWLEAVVNPEKGKGTGYKVVDFETASRDGRPYEAVIAKYTIPNVANPHCTREMKLSPIRAWCRDTFGAAIIDTAIGIRADEPKRISAERAAKNKLHYPLNDLGVDKAEVLAFWDKQPFDLGLPEHLGNCVWCFKKSDSKLVKALHDAPEYFSFPERMESKYPIGGNGKRVFFFRKSRTVADIQALADVVGHIPDMFVHDGGCSESCEFVAALD